jgi:hypothetical protein
LNPKNCGLEGRKQTQKHGIMKAQPNSIKTLLLAVVALQAFVACSNAAIVTSTANASTLANAILGGGVTLVGAPTFTGLAPGVLGPAGSAGTFTGGGVPYIFPNGIVLTTGDASIAARSSNTSTSAGRDNSRPGNANLNVLTGGVTHDATALDFDFKFNGGGGGSLFFNYVFASEEYNEYVGSQYNDAFAFFLDGVNIAKLPNNTPVTINNVNLGANSAFYRNNSPGPLATEYDGLTTLLTASATGLSAGIHHIQLVIADTADGVYDSAVFIQGGSFSDIVTAVPDSASSMLLLGLGVTAVGLLRRRVVARG